MVNYVFVSFICSAFCLVLAASYPYENKNAVLLPEVVLDQKKDCGIINNGKAIAFFHSHECDVPLPRFQRNFFKQRNFLACFGIYDALYHLCEFNIDDIHLDVPSAFKAPTTYCQNASVIYKQLNFSHQADEVTKWSQALTHVMTNNQFCESLCIFEDTLNEQCSAMLTAAAEYLRLKALKPHPAEKPQSLLTTIVMNLHKKNDEHSTVSNDKLHSLKLEEAHLEKITPQPPISSILPDKASYDISFHSNNLNVQSNLVKAPDNKPEIAPVLDKSDISAVPSITTGTNVNPTSDKKVADENSQLPKTGDPNERIASKATQQQAGSDLVEPVNPSITSSTRIQSSQPSHIEKIATSNQQQDDILKEDKNEQPADESTDIDPQNAEIEDAEIGSKPFDEGKTDPKEEDESLAKMDAQPDWESSLPLKDHFVDTEDSYTFSYFATIAILCFVAYFLYHYKNKLLALALEGRKSRNKRGRPSSANYSKLHSNLEEAIASNVSTPSATHVLY